MSTEPADLDETNDLHPDFRHFDKLVEDALRQYEHGVGPPSKEVIRQLSLKIAHELGFEQIPSESTFYLKHLYLFGNIEL